MDDSGSEGAYRRFPRFRVADDSRDYMGFAASTTSGRTSGFAEKATNENKFFPFARRIHAN